MTGPDMQAAKWPDWKVGASIVREGVEGIVQTIVEDPATVAYLEALAARVDTLETALREALAPPTCCQSGCANQAREDSIYCDEHRYYPIPARDECLHSHCRTRRLDYSPWCSQHTHEADKSYELLALQLRLDAVRAALSAADNQEQR